MRAVLSVIFFVPLVLTGCSLGPTAEPSAASGVRIQGAVHGGQQPISSSHVYLFAASSFGYGSPSASLLTNVAGSTTMDTSGSATNGDYYVTTDSNGNFAITGDYSCTPNTQVYLYAVGGNPGAGTNSSVGLLAALGNCPNTDNFLAAAPYVIINEVSTIAAAYAFAGFATDATHVASTNTALAETGIQNAFANAANLAQLSSGQALANTPAPSSGIAPQATVNTLADILASCVNSTGAVSGPTNPTACYTLFTNATSDGLSTGVQPTETATAAINIAHNPAANVANLSALVTAQSPFLGLPIQANDFTLGIQYSGGGLNDPNFIAIDGAGDAWMTNSGSSSVTEFAANGNPMSTSAGYTGGGMDGVVGIAIDPTGDAWIVNDLTGGGSIIELSPTGSVMSGSGFGGSTLGAPNAIAIDGSGNAWITSSNNQVTELNKMGAAYPLSPFTLGGLSDPLALAIDGAGNIWIANNNNTVTELNSLGTPTVLSPYTGGGLDSPVGIAIDHSANAWIANSGDDTMTELGPLGTPASGSPYSGNLDQPEAVAIDGAGNVWTANEFGGSVSELSSSGANLSGDNGFGYNAGSIDLPDAIAVDGSGNVWIGNLSGTGAAQNTGSVTELIGAATPVVTPLSIGVKNNALGVRP